MTISITNNPDGSMTVVCGLEMVIVAGKTPAANPVSLPGPVVTAPAGDPADAQDGEDFVDITQPNSAVAASIVASRDFDSGLKLVNVTSEYQIVQALRSQRTRIIEAGGATPTLMRFGWRSANPIDIGPVSAALREAHGGPAVYCEIHFPPADD